MTTTLLIPHLPSAPASLTDARWEQLPRHHLTCFHAASSAHRPEVDFRIGYSDTHLHLRFNVHDQYVVSRITDLNGPVCGDSCVEFFVEPLAGAGYFNFEINAGGTLHGAHITDPTPSPTASGFAGHAFLSAAELGSIGVATSAPPLIETEITTPYTWMLATAIPFALFSKRLGRMPAVPGTWRGNFYKCADHSSQPHWVSWAPIGEPLAFHVPERFGNLHLHPGA